MGLGSVRSDRPKVGAIARLIYSAVSSLDGYSEDADGRFDWGGPDEQAHAFINQLERPVGT